MSKSAPVRMVRDRAEAMELLREWEPSGERMSDWCGRRGINWYSLNAHHGRGAMSVPEFVELTVSEPAVPAAMARYRLCVGDFTLEVEDDFCDDSVRRLLHLAATC